jgi:nitrogenase molybdenum-iron protein beta chain
MQQYLYGKTVALWGDPDQLVSLVEVCVEMGMQPRYVVTGTPSKSFEKRLADVVAGRCPEMRVASGPTADMLLLHSWIKRQGVDLLIGGTHGKYIARDEGIPLVRHGFPILDRVGHQYFPTAGYMGGMRLVEQILNAFLDGKDAHCPEESFELVM